MQITRAADYAVRIMIHLATLPPGSRPNCGVLAQAGEIPEHFVLKILQLLVRARLIQSQRGAGGGFTLAVDPREITLLDIVEAVEGPTALNACLARGLGCTRKGWCPAHSVWAEAQEAMTAVLRRATIAALAQKAAQEV
jgi:Rrf2 family protein